MNGRNRIAIYGGTFDPVHLGHLEVARKVCALFEIEQLRFVPAKIAPHKSAQEVTAAIHRYAMLALATQDDLRLLVSTFELEAPDRRFTVDTLAHFKSELGSASGLFFVMGADSWSEIATWREWENLLTMVNHIVVTRPGYEISFDHVSASVRERIVDLRGSESVFENSKPSEKNQIFITDMAMVDISATEIRRAARENNWVYLSGLVPSQVANYIRKYGVYQELDEA